MPGKKNTWFDDTFLPSLFERYQETKNKPDFKGFIWLSEKQFDCFKRQSGVKSQQLMTQNTINGGFYVFGCVYEYNWNERSISVYPCKNGIAKLHFGNTEEEKELFRQSEKSKEKYRKFVEAKRLKLKMPEKFMERMKKAEESLLLHIKCVDASAASEDDEDFLCDLEDLERAEERYYRYYFA